MTSSFYFVTNSNLCNYADEYTLYAIDKKLHVAKSNLEANLLFCRDSFMRIIMILNPGKCYYMLISNHDDPNEINLDGTKITSFNNEKLLGMLID